MKITIEPTREMVNITLDGNAVAMRIWRGTSEGGVPVEMYVVSVVPDENFIEQFKKEVPPFMMPSRQAYAIGDFTKEPT